MRRQLAPKPGGNDDDNEGDNSHFFIPEDDGRESQAVTTNVIIREEQEAEFVTSMTRTYRHKEQMKVETEPLQVQRRHKK